MYAVGYFVAYLKLNLCQLLSYDLHYVALLRSPLFANILQDQLEYESFGIQDVSWLTSLP